ncbi:MAG: hypothetical protein KI790_15910 [Cyclobacteriaceae bacterium]|nr:hypothetical protein [Cyclobacteriaceae bacterium HetDA_MAG_MS6]
MSEEELDRLFQEAADKNQFAYDPKAWNALQDSMGSPVPASSLLKWLKSIFWVVPPVIIAVLLLGGQGEKTTDQTQAILASEASIEKLQEQNEKVQKDIATQPVELSSQHSGEVANSLTTEGEESNSSMAFPERKESGSIPSSDSVSTNSQSKKEPAAANEAVIQRSTQLKKQSVVIVPFSADPLPVEKIDEPGKPRESILSLLDGKNGILITDTLANHNLYWPVYDASDSISTGAVLDTSPLIFEKNRFRHGFLISPDISSVGFLNADKVGWELGLTGEYFMTDQISLSSSVSFSKKIYYADQGFEEYPGANPNWDLEQVDASCNVLDWSVYANAYFNANEENKWFISTGLVTYFMLTEDYTFRYSNWRDGNWNIKNENQHLFGLVHLSVGYEKPIGKRLSLQVEPYAKLPITNIGGGNLKLLTSGFRLTLMRSVYKKP